MLPIILSETIGPKESGVDFSLPKPITKIVSLLVTLFYAIFGFSLSYLSENEIKDLVKPRI